MAQHQKAGLSYWEKSSFFSNIDFCIIGSGIVGINAALHLRSLHPTSRIVILEKGMIPTGASTRNAGFACFGSITELLDDLNHSSENEVFSLVEKRWKGLERLQKIVGPSLQYVESGGYELFGNQDEDIYQACEEKIEHYNSILKGIIGRENTYIKKDASISSFGFKQVTHIILNTAEGAIHTGKMMSTLLTKAQENNIEIFNGANVRSINEIANQIEIQLGDGREIISKKVLIATNGFARDLIQNENVVAVRNQVLITKEIPNLKIKGTFHYDKGYYYFRNVGNRILFGGGRNLSPKIEETDQFGTTNIIQKRLIHMMHEIILPETSFAIDMWWSGILGVGQSKKPIIKKISNHVALAVRMGGMGVAIGSLVGVEGAELIGQ